MSGEGGAVDWGALRAHVITCTGWTWEQAGRLTMPRLQALNRYWRQHPPVHLLVAAYLDYKAPAEDEPQTTQRRPATEQPVDPRTTPWMTGMGAVPANDALRSATTTAEALAALERTFFGELMEI